MSKQHNETKPQGKERIELNIPKRDSRDIEKGNPNAGVNEGYQPTKNENPNPPGSLPTDKNE